MMIVKNSFQTGKSDLIVSIFMLLKIFVSVKCFLLSL